MLPTHFHSDYLKKTAGYKSPSYGYSTHAALAEKQQFDSMKSNIIKEFLFQAVKDDFL